MMIKNQHENQAAQPELRQVGKWTLGLLQGADIPASFDDPLDDELLALFEGKDDVKLTDEGS